MKPVSKEWLLPVLKESYPSLMPGYERLYRGIYAPDEYTMKILNLVENACQMHSLPLAGPMMEIKSAKG